MQYEIVQSSLIIEYTFQNKFLFTLAQLNRCHED